MGAEFKRPKQRKGIAQLYKEWTDSDDPDRKEQLESTIRRRAADGSEFPSAFNHIIEALDFSIKQQTAHENELKRSQQITAKILAQNSPEALAAKSESERIRLIRRDMRNSQLASPTRRLIHEIEIGEVDKVAKNINDKQFSHLSDLEKMNIKLNHMSETWTEDDLTPLKHLVDDLVDRFGDRTKAFADGIKERAGREGLGQASFIARKTYQIPLDVNDLELQQLGSEIAEVYGSNRVSSLTKIIDRRLKADSLRAEYLENLK